MSARSTWCAFAGLALLAATAGAAEIESGQGEPNALANHPSPYLAQHGHDPVRWRLWGPDALEEARRDGKLLFLSVGYFACHWCHVMRRESFMDDEIAAVINESYVPVKVDRELEPALDAHLIEFIQAVRNSAGWPLNVVMTPEGYPLTAFTYMPRDMFSDVMTNVQARWSGERIELEGLAKEAAQQIAQTRPPRATARLEDAAVASLAHEYREQALTLADTEQGGFGQKAKFPSTPQLLALLAQDARAPDERSRAFVTTTLDAMAKRGLRDRLGGGFFRYTTDVQWRVPHFEKMLYDNALLSLVYLRAADVYGAPRYLEVALDTLEFMRRELWRPAGAFVASLSAVDADDVEGGYYLWTDADLAAVLEPDEQRAARLALGFGGPSALAHGMLPTDAMEDADVGGRLGLTVEAARAQVGSSVRKLLAARASRSLPVDDKLLAGWNGLALSALAAAQSTPGGERFRPMGERLSAFLVNELWNGRLLRRAAQGGGSASLEDYAFVSRGLVDWHTATAASGASATLEAARLIAVKGLDMHYVEGGWQLGAGALIPMAPGEAIVSDVSLPSSSATLLGAARDVAALAGDDALAARVSAVLRIDSEQLRKVPYLYPTHVALLARAFARP